MSTKFLNQAYGISTLDSRDLYTAWSDSYDKEVHENGYVTPLRVAEALDRHVLDKNTTVLDYGCGTGLSGQALLNVGFQAVDGVDVTAAMVDLAREKGIYRNLDVFSPRMGQTSQRAHIRSSPRLGSSAQVPRRSLCLIRSWIYCPRAAISPFPLTITR